MFLIRFIIVCILKILTKKNNFFSHSHKYDDIPFCKHLFYNNRTRSTESSWNSPVLHTQNIVFVFFNAFEFFWKYHKYQNFRNIFSLWTKNNNFIQFSILKSAKNDWVFLKIFCLSFIMLFWSNRIKIISILYIWKIL